MSLARLGTVDSRALAERLRHHPVRFLRRAAIELAIATTDQAFAQDV